MTCKKCSGLYIYKCLRCGYKWSGKKKPPKTCANRECKSLYWNKPKKVSSSNIGDIWNNLHQL